MHWSQIPQRDGLRRGLRRYLPTPPAAAPLTTRARRRTDGSPPWLKCYGPRLHRGERSLGGRIGTVPTQHRAVQPATEHHHIPGSRATLR